MAGDDGHDTAGPQLVQGLAQEIIVDAEIVLVIGWVMDLVLPEGDIAHGDIEEIYSIGGLKDSDGDVRLRV